MNKLSLDRLKNSITPLLSKYRVIIVALIVLGLFGYTLIRALDINDPRIDHEYREQLREEIETATISVDAELRERIESLIETPVDDNPSDLGTRDPFNP